MGILTCVHLRVNTCKSILYVKVGGINMYRFVGNSGVKGRVE